MTSCFFVSDLHGKKDRYGNLFTEILIDKPKYLFIGGDNTPHGLSDNGFFSDYLFPLCNTFKRELGNLYPTIYIISGNDDTAVTEDLMFDGEKLHLWKYVHNKIEKINDYYIAGYSFVPPSPFILKDWEKYDVSRYADPGCIHPHEGVYTKKVDKSERMYTTIASDLDKLTEGIEKSKLILLAHSPPYKTKLDMVDHKGKLIEGVDQDPHVGSIAIRNFIDKHQPYITMHGHIHESARLSGGWMDQLGKTVCFNAAIDTGELCVIKFELEEPEKAERFLI